MSVRFKTSRFHISTGPESLFKRIHFIMYKKTELKLNASHFQHRVIERNAPVEEFRFFNPESWKLVTAEVRVDTGKFVSTSWQVALRGRIWWVIIGLKDTIETIIPTEINKKGLGEKIIKSGDLFDFVEEVNKKL